MPAALAFFAPSKPLPMASPALLFFSFVEENLLWRGLEASDACFEWVALTAHACYQPYRRCFGQDGPKIALHFSKERLRERWFGYKPMVGIESDIIVSFFSHPILSPPVGWVIFLNFFLFFSFLSWSLASFAFYSFSKPPVRFLGINFISPVAVDYLISSRSSSWSHSRLPSRNAEVLPARMMYTAFLCMLPGFVS